MPKSIKLKNDTYIDSSGIVHNKQNLKDVLTKSIGCNYGNWQDQQVIEGTGRGSNITGMDTTIETHGGNILVAMTLPISHSGGTCWLNIYIDSTLVMQYGISHNVGALSYVNVFKVSAGTHRVHVAIHNNNVNKVTIYNYTSKAFTVAEI